MVIDTSAVLAILQNEPERRTFNEAIETAETRSMSTASFVESSMILESRYGADGVRDLDLFIAKAQITLVPVDVELAHLARQAFRQYGKGRHPAGLNYGDCFSYALSRSLAEPLLFKGDDFTQCDIECHPASRKAPSDRDEQPPQ
jgi:ribonuclease VapC